MGNDVLVSVCIQTYRHVNYIEQCLDSVLSQQTSFNFEIIIGEDESDDGTREKCIEYSKKYPDKIRLFLRNRKDVIYVNGKPTGRFNMIENIKAARGSFIAILEGDDYWIDNNKLQKQVDFLNNYPNVILCHTWHKNGVYDSNGLFKEVDAPRKDHGYLNKKITTVSSIFNNKLRCKSRTMLFRNSIKEFPDWFYEVAYGDVALTMILGKYGDFGFIDEPTAVYRLTGSGVSTEGKGGKDFFLNHYLNYCKIWEKGDQFHNYKYHKESLKTQMYFYRFVLRKYNFDKEISKILISHIKTKSENPFISRKKILFLLRLEFLKSLFFKKSDSNRKV